MPPSLLEQFKDEDKYEEFLNDLSEVELIVDTSEQSRQRTMDKAEREKCYSGYKHNHTVKKIITLPKAKDIIAVSIGGYGTKADITIFREIQLQFKSEQKFKKDKVFVEGNNISTLHKKSKKKELAEQKNEENKIFSEKSFCWAYNLDDQNI